MTRTFTRVDELAKYRVSMKRQLRRIGCHIDNDMPTEELEFLMMSNRLEV